MKTKLASNGHGLLQLRLLTYKLNRMNRKEIKEFLETLHFHGYIDHDITKLGNLIDDYYPKQLQQADVIKSVCDRCEGNPESADNVLCNDCYTDLHGM